MTTITYGVLKQNRTSFLSGWTLSPFWIKLIAMHNFTFCCHAPSQAKYCSMHQAVIIWYTASVDAVCTTLTSVVSSQWQQQRTLYRLGPERMTYFLSQSSWCSVHNCIIVTVDQMMTTMFSLTLWPIKSSVPLNRIAAAMPKQIKLCTNLTGTQSLCNVWNIHVPDGLLWQQPNSSFLSAIT